MAAPGGMQNSVFPNQGLNQSSCGGRTEIWSQLLKVLAFCILSAEDRVVSHRDSRKGVWFRAHTHTPLQRHTHRHTHHTDTHTLPTHTHPPPQPHTPLRSHTHTHTSLRRHTHTHTHPSDTPQVDSKDGTGPDLHASSEGPLNPGRG